jgi:DNA-binding transcriptional ArsR family regulator
LPRRHNLRLGAGPGAPAPLFAALGDKTRLWLVSRLSAGPLSITCLTAGSRVTRQAITKHLRVLEGAGLLRSTRRGRESIWQLKQKRLREARRYLELVSLQWDDAIGRLRKFVEE